MIRTVPAQLGCPPNPTTWVTCARAGRFAAEMRAMLRLTRQEDDKNSEVHNATEAWLILGTAVDDVITFTINGQQVNDEFRVAFFDEETGFMLISVFTGEEGAGADFYRAFGLLPGEADGIVEATLAYVAAYLDRDHSETVKAIAMIALGDDRWELDTHTQSIELQSRLIGAAKAALAAL